MLIFIFQIFTRFSTEMRENGVEGSNNPPCSQKLKQYITNPGNKSKTFIAKEIWRSPRRLNPGKVLNGHNIPLFPLQIIPI